MSVQMLIRVEPETKEALSKIARQEGKSASFIVREIIKDYIKDRDLGAYVDDLWNRMGKKLNAGGIDRGDVARAIKDVRKDKHAGSN
ncbi:MAG: ribbon-helix-helix protein, CopG family [bacterium]|nr:ribbon-helix-helix protein, CopG family [bacterium]